MRKLFNLLWITALVFSFSACSRENLSSDTGSKEDLASISTVKSELYGLNQSYIPAYGQQKRIPKWLRWLIFGAADVAGAIYGGVSGACSSSALAWTITKTETNAVSNNPTELRKDATALKANYLKGLEPGSAGFIHNSVISATFSQDKDIYNKTNDEVINSVLKTYEQQMGVTIPLNKKAEIINCTHEIVNSLSIDKSVKEYFDELKTQTTDSTKKQAFEVCGIVLDGLQYVNDNDSSYVVEATKIVRKSNLSSELKSTLIRGISVANASAQLWNTDGIKSAYSRKK